MGEIDDQNEKVASVMNAKGMENAERTIVINKKTKKKGKVRISPEAIVIPNKGNLPALFNYLSCF